MWHGEQLSQVSHHSSASAKQLASKIGLEKLRAGGDSYVNSICTCKDELKEHLAPVREWKKEFDAQLKATGKLQTPDDVDRSLDPFLGIAEGSKSAEMANREDLALDQAEPAERQLDALEARLERVMLDSYGYNPVRQELDVDPAEQAVQEEGSISPPDMESTAEVAAPAGTGLNRRTGITPDLDALLHHGGVVAEDLSRPAGALCEQEMHVTEKMRTDSSKPVPYAGRQPAPQPALLIDFSDDEEDDDEEDGSLIIRDASTR